MSTSESLIEKNISDFKELQSYLQEHGELSFLATTQVFSIKSIILSIASHFETQIVDIIHEALGSNEDILLHSFIEKKALERQYHQLFSWSDRKLNHFFAFFGSDFKDYAIKATRDDTAFLEAASSFLELGDMRNRLVHINYISFSIDWTIEEIEAKWNRSKTLPDKVLALISSYRETQAASEPNAE